MTVGVAPSHTRPAFVRPAIPSVRPKRRAWLLVACLLSMVVCAGAFAMVYLSVDSRIQVLATSQAVAAGQTIAVTDLRVVRVVPDAGITLVPASQASRVIGATARVPLVAGALVTVAQLGPTAWPPLGQAVTAIPVKAGRLAEGVSAGAKVLVIPVAKEDEPEASTPALSPVRATVVEVAPTDASGSFVVSLLVSRADAIRVAGIAGELSIAVAQD